ncbi:MAG: hypothetical protein J7K69_00750 [Thermotogae bacterium]|nr:hypothetical protein [Thermotogota bacterium]
MRILIFFLVVNFLGFLSGFFGKNGKYRIINPFNEWLFSLGGGVFGFLIALSILKKIPTTKDLIGRLLINFVLYASLIIIFR